MQIRTLPHRSRRKPTPGKRDRRPRCPLLDGRRRRRFFLGGVVALLFVVMLQPAWQLVRPQGADGPLSPFGVELKMLPDDILSTFGL